MNGIDCSTRLTTASAQALKNVGISSIGRYLGYKQGWWKSLTLDEVKAIHGAGLSLFLIWESSPTKASYFSYAKGISDAKLAISEADFLGAPQGVAIYFTVDYDAQLEDMTAITEYFRGVKDGLSGKYLVGVYGSYSTMKVVSADKYYQTYAWSGGQIAPSHIYQYSNDVMLAGITVDKDYVNEDAGLWKEEGVGIKVFANLVIYQDGADKRAAEYLADYLKAPIVSIDNVTPELLACATNKYKVGGSAYTGAQLISGPDRFGTMSAVLKFAGK